MQRAAVVEEGSRRSTSSTRWTLVRLYHQTATRRSPRPRSVIRRSFTVERAPGAGVSAMACTRDTDKLFINRPVDALASNYVSADCGTKWLDLLMLRLPWFSRALNTALRYSLWMRPRIHRYPLTMGHSSDPFASTTLIPVEQAHGSLSMAFDVWENGTHNFNSDPSAWFRPVDGQWLQLLGEY